MHTDLDTQARTNLVLVFESTMIMSNARLTQSVLQLSRIEGLPSLFGAHCKMM